MHGHPYLIPSLGIWRQKDGEFKDNLDYVARPDSREGKKCRKVTVT